ncbi:MAG: hypothetical protein ACLQQ4_17360 [Bacteroidia bacterium]
MEGKPEKTEKPDKTPTERAVTNLQLLFNLIIGLALTRGVQTVLTDSVSNKILPWKEIISNIAPFFVFALLIIPFTQGMNRYFEKTYLEDKEMQKVSGALLFDFMIFFAESICLYAFSVTLDFEPHSLIILLLLFMVDSFWVFMLLKSLWKSYSFPVIEKNIKSFLYLNLATLLIGVIISITLYYFLNNYFSHNQIAIIWVFLASIRTFFDYKINWNFYFPISN